MEKLKLAAKLLADSKEHVLEAKALDESARLLQMQEVFEKDLQGERFVGDSVNETVFKLIRMGYSSRANKVKSEFKIPEKRFWWLKLRALVAKRDWGEIEEWGRTKKSPIGWEVCFTLSSGSKFFNTHHRNSRSSTSACPRVIPRLPLSSYPSAQASHQQIEWTCGFAAAS